MSPNINSERTRNISQTFIYNKFREDNLESFFGNRELIEKGGRSEGFVLSRDDLMFDRSVMRSKIMREGSDRKTFA